jgi:pimeloyl-ACP methyl ester carboxylesterase
VWRPIADKLRPRRAPILVDYPGLGNTTPDPSIRSLSELADAVLSTLPARVDVVSLSMGSALALRFAVLHPSRVRKLVLVTAAGGVNAGRFGALDWRPAFRRKRPDAPSWFVDDDTDLTPRLREMFAPTLLVFGERDLVAPVAVGRHLQEHLPFARLEVIEGATHDLEEEHPDFLASLVEAHLRTPDPE